MGSMLIGAVVKIAVVGITKHVIADKLFTEAEKKLAEHADEQAKKVRGY